jgi:hypothetical protein
MELCSIQDAFPDIQKGGQAPPGCADVKSSKEERRAARKRAKKCKGPAEEYLNAVDDVPTDPDRPAIKRLGEIPAFVSYADAFPDLSGGKFEAFKMPTLPSANCLTSDAGYPSYFGKGIDDVADEAPSVDWASDAAVKAQQAKIISDPADLKRLTGSIGSGAPDAFAKAGSTVGSAGYNLYNAAATEDEGFTNMFNDSADTVLNETFEYEFGGDGVAKAGSVASKTLPAPSLEDAWKPLTAAKTTTAFFKGPPPPRDPPSGVEENLLKKEGKVSKQQKNPEPPKQTSYSASGSDQDTMRNQMAQQMEQLVKKFEDLEARRQRDTKHEVLLFVGTGLFVLVSLDIVARLARR